MTVEGSLGVIGLGNMGRALVKGIIDEGKEPAQIHVYDIDREKVDRLVDEHDVSSVDSIDQLVSHCDFLLVCVKPKDIRKPLNEIDEPVSLISIAAGVELNDLQNNLPDGSSVIRVMPNTPAQVSEGMSFLTPDSTVDDEFIEQARAVFEAVGEASVIDESKMDAVTALSGSGPAYGFFLLEAMYEAGVYMGLEHDEALLAAKQTILGASRLAKQSDRAPGELRSNVSSPGGTTVEAMKHLEEEGVKGHIMEAIKRAKDKSEEL